GTCDRDLFTAHVPGGDSFGREGVQLAGDNVSRVDFIRGADAVRDYLYPAVRDRRAGRVVSGRAFGGCPLTRHLLCRGAFSLRHDGRHSDGFSRRLALLYAEDDGAYVFREGRA